METQKLYQKVAGDIAAMMRRGRLRVGERLPPERDLALELAVSRTTVREALLALEFEDLIDIRGRSGAFVRRVPGRAAARRGLALRALPGPYEVLHLRRLIEGEAAYLAAVNAQPKRVRAIVRACDANERIGPNDTRAFHDATRVLHMRIAEASEIGLIVELLEYLWEQKEGPLWDTWYRGSKSRDNRVETLRHNRRIANAIAARRPEAARTAMHGHIDMMVERFLAYGDAET